MTQEDKQLLLKDLCARLPYNFVYCYCNAPFANGKPIILTPVVVSNLMNATEDLVIKPYLRPMSSMTEEECELLSKLRPYDEVEAWKYIKTPIPLFIANLKQFDFFHSRHFDWRGLIPKGLAIEVTEKNNPYKY